MKAMVLAAGFGSRMMPLTEKISKVIFPLAGKPVIVRTLEFLSERASVDSFIVNLHHAPGSIKECLRDLPYDIEYSHEKEILGTGGALHKVKSMLADNDETFIMANGDSYFGDCSIDKALEFHREKGSLATMVVMDMPEGDNYGAVEIDEDQKIRRIAGKPEGAESAGLNPCHFVGLHILEPEILSYVSEGRSDINRDIYPQLIAKDAPIYVYHTSFTWFDLGTPSRFLNAVEVISRIERNGSPIVAESSSIGRNSQLIAPVEICAGVRVGEGSNISRSIVMETAEVGEGTELVDCIIGPGVKLKPETRLSKAVAANVNGKTEISDW